MSLVIAMKKISAQHFLRQQISFARYHLAKLDQMMCEPDTSKFGENGARQAVLLSLQQGFVYYLNQWLPEGWQADRRLQGVVSQSHPLAVSFEALQIHPREDYRVSEINEAWRDQQSHLRRLSEWLLSMQYKLNEWQSQNGAQEKDTGSNASIAQNLIASSGVTEVLAVEHWTLSSVGEIQCVLDWAEELLERHSQYDEEF